MIKLRRIKLGLEQYRPMENYLEVEMLLKFTEFYTFLITAN